MLTFNHAFGKPSSKLTIGYQQLESVDLNAYSGFNLSANFMLERQDLHIESFRFGLLNSDWHYETDTGVTTYTYDDGGNQVTRTDARGVTVSRQYDALNRPTKISYPDSLQDVAFQYDTGPHAIGRMASARGPAGTFTYAYDSRGGVSKKTHTFGGKSTGVAYARDSSGRPKSITYPSRQVISYKLGMV